MQDYTNIFVPDPALKALDWKNPFIINRAGYYKKPMHHNVRDGLKEAVVILCLEGQGYVKYKGKEYRIRTGDLIFLEPGISHAYGPDEENPWTILWIHFSGSGVGGLIDLFAKYGIEHISNVKNHTFIADELRRIITMLQNYGDPLNIQKACCALQSLLLDYVETASRSYGDDYYIKKAIRFMKNHIGDNIDLEKISEHLGISTFHTIRLFKGALMTTPMQYYNAMRINEAGRLLQDTDLSVTEISRKLNYSSQFYFSQVFKAKMGLSPAAYKKQMSSKY